MQHILVKRRMYDRRTTPTSQRPGQVCIIGYEIRVDLITIVTTVYYLIIMFSIMQSILLVTVLDLHQIRHLTFRLQALGLTLPPRNFVEKGPIIHFFHLLLFHACSNSRKHNISRTPFKYRCEPTKRIKHVHISV